MGNDSTSNDNLISEIVELLSASTDADQSVVEILAEHIVKIDMADTAVDDAAVAIEQLALKRGELNNQ